MNPFRRPSSADTAAAGDPIPFRIGDETHLFYLSSPADTQDYPERVRTTWQHARSTDLVAWEELTAAVPPGEVGTIDGGGIWTGSLVESDGTFYLFYTGHHVGAANPQTICLATSTDLVNFTRHPANPVLVPTDDYESVDWRDPYVFFNAAEGLWWMLIATRLAEGPHWRRGAIALATSPDLLNWTVEKEPFYTPGDTYCPECPELWELDDRWYLVYSRFSEDVGTIYRMADSPRGPFRIPADERLGGRRWYAAKSAPHPAGRAFFGWVHDRVDAAGTPRWLWGGDFALPRIVSADADGALVVRPADGVLAHWSTVVESAEFALAGTGGHAEARLADALPESALITVGFSQADAAVVGLDLLTDAQDAGWRIEIDRAGGRVRLLQVPAPLDDFWADLTDRSGQYREVDGPILAAAGIPVGTGSQLRVVLDGEMFEAYVDDRIALTQRLSRASAVRPGVFALSGSTIATVEVRRPQ